MTLRGRTVTVAPLRRRMRPRSSAAFRGADEMWDYMPIGPFATEADLADWIAAGGELEDPLFFSFSPVGGGSGGVRQLPPDHA
jgi:hypothetical protein